MAGMVRISPSGGIFDIFDRKTRRRQNKNRELRKARYMCEFSYVPSENIRFAMGNRSRLLKVINVEQDRGKLGNARNGIGFQTDGRNGRGSWHLMAGIPLCLYTDS